MDGKLESEEPAEEKAQVICTTPTQPNTQQEELFVAFMKREKDVMSPHLAYIFLNAWFLFPLEE